MSSARTSISVDSRSYPRPTKHSQQCQPRKLRRIASMEPHHHRRCLAVLGRLDLDSDVELVERLPAGLRLLQKFFGRCGRRCASRQSLGVSLGLPTGYRMNTGVTNPLYGSFQSSSSATSTTRWRRPNVAPRSHGPNRRGRNSILLLCTRSTPSNMALNIWTIFLRDKQTPIAGLKAGPLSRPWL